MSDIIKYACGLVVAIVLAAGCNKPVNHEVDKCPCVTSKNCLGCTGKAGCPCPCCDCTCPGHGECTSPH